MVPAVLSGNLVLAIMRGGMHSVVYSFINFPDVCVFSFLMIVMYLSLFNYILILVSTHVK